MITEHTHGNLKAYFNIKDHSLTTHQIIDIGMQVLDVMYNCNVSLRAEYVFWELCILIVHKPLIQMC